MKPQKAVVHETLRIAIGSLALTGVMLIVYAIAGKFSAKAALGGLYACALAVLNFFALGLTVQASVESIQGEDPIAANRAKTKMQMSYTFRMIAIFALALVGIVAWKLDALACLIPLVFPRIVILLLHISDGKNKTHTGSEIHGN